MYYTQSLGKGLNAIQTAKYELKSNNTSAMDYFRRKSPKTDTVHLFLCRNMKSSHNTYANNMKQAEKAQEVKQKVTKRARDVKRIMSLAVVARKAALVQSNKRNMQIFTNLMFHDLFSSD